MSERDKNNQLFVMTFTNNGGYSITTMPIEESEVQKILQLGRDSYAVPRQIPTSDGGVFYITPSIFPSLMVEFKAQVATDDE